MVQLFAAICLTSGLSGSSTDSSAKCGWEARRVATDRWGPRTGQRQANFGRDAQGSTDLPDFWKVMALGRVRAMLRPGGIFRLWDVAYGFNPEEADERIEAWCAPFGNEVEGDWARWEMEEHVRDEHSTFTWLLEQMFERTGFAVEVADYSDDEFDARYLLRAYSS